ncbi:MAG: hypothetical protein AAF799_43815 [Myxococcota bacterium]
MTSSSSSPKQGPPSVQVPPRTPSGKQPPGELIADPKPKCRIGIFLTAANRNFMTFGGTTGVELFIAIANPKPTDTQTVKWSVVRGANDGNVRFDKSDQLITRVFADKPNNTKVKVEIIENGQSLCSAEAEISVPQFFEVGRVSFTETFEDLGFTATPDPKDSMAVKAAKAQLELDTIGLINVGILDAAARPFDGVNVRFVGKAPPAVLAKNVTSVALTEFRAATSNILGEAGLDVGNKDPNQTLEVYVAQHGAEGSSPFGALFRRVFNPIARRYPAQKAGGRKKKAFGTPIQPGDVLIPPRPGNVRQLQVAAAIYALTQFLGATVAHEAGHSLGLVPGGAAGAAGKDASGHNAKPAGNIMDAATGFAVDTGIQRYDPKTGKLTRTKPAGFTAANLAILRKILPVLG